VEFKHKTGISLLLQVEIATFERLQIQTMTNITDNKLLKIKIKTNRAQQQQKRIYTLTV